MDSHATNRVRVRIHQQIFEAQMGENAVNDINLNGLESNIVKALQECTTCTFTMKKYTDPVSILYKELIAEEQEESQPMELDSEVCTIKLLLIDLIHP